MKLRKALEISLFLLVWSGISQCQERHYGPGLDFALFKGTPVEGLAEAVESQDTAAIADLVRAGSPIDYKEPKYGNTLLFLAVSNDKELSTAKLLNAGANPNTRTHSDSSPFLAACAYSFDIKNPSKMLLLLIAHGADVNSIQRDTTKNQFGKRKQFETTALRSLCIYGSLPSVKVVVEHGACLTCYDKDENSILSTAVLSGNLDIVKYLMIERKAPIPDYVTIRQPGTKSEKKLTITELLNEENYNSGNATQQELKKEILDYLGHGSN